MRHGDGVRISNEQEIQNMLGYTKIQIMGNLGGTPEMKFLPSGDPVVNFSVAVNRRYKDREGNQKEATDWFRVCAFNGVGKACAKHLQKGDGIFVEGRLQVRQYDSKQNGKEVSVEIIPSTVRFLGSGRSDGTERPAPGKPPAGARETADGADGSDPDVPLTVRLDRCHRHRPPFHALQRAACLVPDARFRHCGRSPGNARYWG